MFGDIVKNITETNEQNKADVFVQRRKKLLELIAQAHPEKDGAIFLFAPIDFGFEPFLQDSNFYYLSGINESAAVLSLDLYGRNCLYMPNFGDTRSKWLHSLDVINHDTITLFGIDTLQHLGNQVSGYNVEAYFQVGDYKNIVESLKNLVMNKKIIFTLYPSSGSACARVKLVIDRLSLFVPGLYNHIVDISELIATLRRKKDISEIEKIYQAIEITNGAFQAAAHVLRPEASEAQVQAAMEYIFTENHARCAYPSIIAGGKRATILHYHTNREILQHGELVLIDAGAMHNHYCADITRTFPVDGKFTQRQRALYEIVLETQQKVVENIRPGVWLSNAEYPDLSLQHIALNFLKQKGCDQYFNHGIGHFLGLDVHDVGVKTEALLEGDVITIEPGIYISEEAIGIRIEDNYWVVANSEPVCLSEEIPKSVKDIEYLAKQKF